MLYDEPSKPCCFFINFNVFISNGYKNNKKYAQTFQSKVWATQNTTVSFN